MYSLCTMLPATLALTSVAAAASVPYSVGKNAHTPNIAPHLFKRQDNTDSTCYAYGVDFVDGGSYFINTASNASFTCVSEFEGCNNYTADISLVYGGDGTQYDCGTVATVPDDADMMATCGVLKSDMVTGNWSILAIGNNGDGNPFAWERDFYLSCGPQQTTTVTPTATFTITTTPSTTVTSTSTVVTTSIAQNNITVTTPAGTRVVTITPAQVTVTSTNTITRTFKRWTKTKSVATAVITASCTVPPRPQNPDPECKILPTIKPVPQGLSIQTKRADEPIDVENFRKRVENVPAARERAASDIQEKRGAHIAARSADAPTITITASTAVDTTLTVTAPTSTLTDVTITTSTLYTTSPPKTVKAGTEVDTVTAPRSTVTNVTDTYSVTYVTKTIAVTWTYSTTTTPAASATSCKRQGGHFGNGWGRGW